MGATWVVSGRVGVRAAVGALGVAVFGAVALWALGAAVRDPNVPSIALALMTAPFALMALVLAVEGVGGGLVRVDDDGYRSPLGRRRVWADVLGVGRGRVEGRVLPVVAVRADEGFVVTQDTFKAVPDEEADRLVDAYRDRVPTAPGFGSVHLGEGWWRQVEAEADRAAAVVRETSGREPVARRRVEFGFPGLASALLLDYGTNDAGEGVALVVREDAVLALVVDGCRYLRQTRRRSADAAAQVGLLFGDHTTTRVDSDGAGFDGLRVDTASGRPLRFNAEEPDRFA